MPEGHTIHRVAQDHNRLFAGRRLRVSSPQGRFTSDAAKLDGRQLARVDAHGKHLFYEWEGALCLHIHLGLYGKFRVHSSPAPEPRGAVRLRVADEVHTFDLNGPSTCRLVDDEQRSEISARLGQDPLRADADFDSLWRSVQRSRSVIGALLLNQGVFAGVGNIYRTEVLFDQGVDPNRPAHELTRGECRRIWRRLVQWMKVGVKHNRIITAPANGKRRSRMSQEERLLCYKKPSCPRCEADIESWELGGRTIYACLKCQT